jgi:hypothetical protein
MVSDQDSGLSVALRSDNRSKGWWCSRYEGFRYFIHGTNELLSSTNRFQLQFGELTELLIKPKMTITEEDLRSYSLERFERILIKFLRIFCLKFKKVQKDQKFIFLSFLCFLDETAFLMVNEN